jgi:hypothetical protein
MVKLGDVPLRYTEKMFHFAVTYMGLSPSPFLSHYFSHKNNASVKGSVIFTCSIVTMAMKHVYTSLWR